MERDNMGFILLDSFKVINKQFIYNGNKYYFKIPHDFKNIYNELIAYEIALELNIDCVNYDIASYYGDIGNISRDFINNRKIYPLSLININRDDFSINKIKEVLEDNYNNIIVNKLVNELYNILLLDILIDNRDRHSDNLFFNIEDITFYPVNDNSEMFSNIIDDTYGMGINSGTEVLEDIINNLPDEYLEILRDKIDIIKNIDIILDRVEDKIHSKMQVFVRENIKNKFINHYYRLNKLIERRKVL